MSQSSLKSFFPTRKRAAVRDLKTLPHSPKALLLDDSLSSAEKLKGNSQQKCRIVHRTPNLTKALLRSAESKKSADSIHVSQPKSSLIAKAKKDAARQSKQCSKIDSFVKPVGAEKDVAEPSHIENESNFPSKPADTSSKKDAEEVRDVQNKALKQNETRVCEQLSIPECSPSLQQTISERPSTPENSPSLEQAVFEDLGLNDLKARLNRSKHYNALKDSLQRYHSRDAQIKEITSRLLASSSQSQLIVKEFDSIEIEVPVSPFKSPLKPQRLFASPIKSPKLPRSSACRLDFTSPTKSSAYVSPRKLLEAGPSPVKGAPRHLNFESLVNGDALILPFKYRSLFETFCAVDAVSSMFHNRHEKITFSKLKSGVQEMSRRNFLEKHLAQIKTVLPEAFEFSQEKYQVFGKKIDAKYHLIIRPLFSNGKNGSGNEHSLVTPSVLAARKRAFNKSLLEITKHHHKEYLLSLDPPLDIPFDKLTRWHAEFDVNAVPDIPLAELPVSPVQNKQQSARDVLENAKSLLSANARVTAAIDSLSKRLEGEANAATSIKPPPSASPFSASATSSQRSTNDAIAAVSKALKGVPQSFLNKIKAKQAARALESMTRSPAQNKQAVMLSRLPEIARILRNLFVVERKTVLPLDQVTTKMQHSCRENMTPGEIKAHLLLIQQHVPEWLSLCLVRNIDYVKLFRSADIEAVMLKLQQLVDNEGRLYHCR